MTAIPANTVTMPRMSPWSFRRGPGLQSKADDRDDPGDRKASEPDHDHRRCPPLAGSVSTAEARRGRSSRCRTSAKMLYCGWTFISRGSFSLLESTRSGRERFLHGLVFRRRHLRTGRV